MTDDSLGRKSVAEMLGEALREAGVLLAVFMPLEIVLIRGEALTWPWTRAILGIAGGFLAVGILVERLRN